VTLGARDLIASYFTLTGAPVGAPARFTFEDRVAAAASAGFAGIGMHFDDYRALRASGRSDAELRAVLDAHDVQVAEVEFLWDWAYDDDRRTASDGMADSLFEMVDAFAPHHLNIGDINMAEELPTIDVTAERFAEVCERAAQHDVLVALEFLPWSGIPDLATALDVVRGSDSPNAGVLVDAWHYFRGNPDDDLLASLVPGDVSCVQLSDGDRDPEGPYTEDTIFRRRVPGDGAFDLVGLIRTLDADGIDVPYSVELMSTELQGVSVEEMANRAHDATAAVLAEARGD